MTKDEAIEYLPLIAALAEGKTIQFKGSDFASDEWRDVLYMNTEVYSARCFRIKPEPKVIWVNEYENGYGTPHESLESATVNGGNPKAIVRSAVKYIEVIE